MNDYLGVDPMLTNVALAYKNEEYIADKIFTPMGVAKQSGKHFVYDKGRFRINETLRAKGANANEVTLNLTTGNTYFCEDHALRQFVPDEDVDNAVIKGSPAIDAAENVTDMLLIDKEKALATYMANTANLTQNTTLAGTDQWSDFVNSDPFDDIATAEDTIHGSIMQKPNALILGKQVYDKLIRHPDLLDRVKWSAKGVLTIDLLKSLFDVDYVLVGRAGYNSAAEGQTDAMSYVWGKHAWLAYVSPKRSGKFVTFGLTYDWKKMKVEKMRGTDEDDRRGMYVRGGDMYYDQQPVTVLAAYLIKNAIA